VPVPDGLGPPYWLASDAPVSFGHLPAVDDGLIRRNPCRVKGAGSQQFPERPVPTIRQIYDLAEAVGARYRALVLLAVFCSLRWGELAALRRADIDLAEGTVKVARTMHQLAGGGHSFGPPSPPQATAQ
jgi:integrase